MRTLADVGPAKTRDSGQGPRPLVVIPTYNERENLASLVESIRRHLPEAAILVVDDNSPDGTGELADRLAAESQGRLAVLHRPRKTGLGQAYKAGIAWALGGPFDVVCTMDADHSHDPRYLPSLVDLARTKVDIAVGSRYVRGGRIRGWDWSRYLLSWSANLAARLLLGLGTRDATSGYRCYRRSFLAEVSPQEIASPGYAFQVEMLAKAKERGLRVGETPITFCDRTAGRSKVSREELTTSATSFLRLVVRQPALGELFRFALVGSLNVIVDLGVTNFLVLAFRWPPRLAGYSGMAVALLSSFWLNRTWTFRVTSKRVMPQFARFSLVNGLGAAVHAAVYTALLSRSPLPYNLAKLVAIGVAFVWNFLGTKHWAFHPSRSLSRRTGNART